MGDLLLRTLLATYHSKKRRALVRCRLFRWTISSNASSPWIQQRWKCIEGCAWRQCNFTMRPLNWCDFLGITAVYLHHIKYVLHASHMSRVRHFCRQHLHRNGYKRGRGTRWLAVQFRYRPSDMRPRDQRTYWAFGRRDTCRTVVEIGWAFGTWANPTNTTMC